MDAIDKRNMRDKIARSIIKRNCVHYVTQEELDHQKDEEEQKRIRELCERLKAEAAAEEEKKQKEIDEAVRRQKNFNSVTKAYSGEYGKNMPEDEATIGQIEKILSEKKDAFERTLEEQLDK